MSQVKVTTEYAKCQECLDSGMVWQSWADPENGPTADPADESGFEYCSCETGYAAWFKDIQVQDEQEKSFFDAFNRGDL